MFEFQDLQERDIPEVSALLMRLYERYIAHDFPPKAQGGIRQYLSVPALRARLGLRHFALVCRTSPSFPAGDMDGQAGEAISAGVIVGIIEVRDYRHISLLFVDDDYQRRGIASTLLARAVERCRRHAPGLTEITVRASPYAMPIYERLGFVPDPDADEPDSPARAMKLPLDT
jgi:GNAT superfamily N-acetyltransferase